MIVKTNYYTFAKQLKDDNYHMEKNRRYIVNVLLIISVVDFLIYLGEFFTKVQRFPNFACLY